MNVQNNIIPYLPFMTSVRFAVEISHMFCCTCWELLGSEVMSSARVARTKLPSKDGSESKLKMMGLEETQKD